jgi:hypothetical protein
MLLHVRKENLDVGVKMLRDFNNLEVGRTDERPWVKFIDSQILVDFHDFKYLNVIPTAHQKYIFFDELNWDNGLGLYIDLLNPSRFLTYIFSICFINKQLAFGPN